MEKSENVKLPAEGQAEWWSIFILLGFSPTGNFANSSVLSMAILPFTTEA
jgi:hypothetical protein